MALPAMPRRPVIQIPHPQASPTLRRALVAVRREFIAAGLGDLLDGGRLAEINLRVVLLQVKRP